MSVSAYIYIYIYIFSSIALRNIDTGMFFKTNFLKEFGIIKYQLSQKAQLWAEYY